MFYREEKLVNTAATQTRNIYMTLPPGEYIAELTKSPSPLAEIYVLFPLMNTPPDCSLYVSYTITSSYVRNYLQCYIPLFANHTRIHYIFGNANNTAPLDAILYGKHGATASPVRFDTTVEWSDATRPADGYIPLTKPWLGDGSDTYFVHLDLDNGANMYQVFFAAE